MKTDWLRKEDESEYAYIYRIGNIKEQIGSWQDVADLLNYQLGYQYTESKYFEYAETTLFTMLRQAYIAGWKDSADCAPRTWSKPVHRPRRERRRRHTE